MVGIYENVPQFAGPDGAGKPGNLIAQGNLFSPGGTLPNQIRNTYLHIDLTTPSGSPGAPLVADTLYWAAVGHQATINFPPAAAFRFQLVEHQNYGTTSGIVRFEDNVIVPATLPLTANATNTNQVPFWFRIYDPSSSFIVGPQGATGPCCTGPTGAAASTQPVIGEVSLPYEPYWITNSDASIKLAGSPYDAQIVYSQFMAKTNGTYTQVTVYSVEPHVTTPLEPVDSQLGVAIYENQDFPTGLQVAVSFPTTPVYEYVPGLPFTQMSEGFLDLSGTAADYENTYLTVDLNTPVTLETNKLYWFAVACSRRCNAPAGAPVGPDFSIAAAPNATRVAVRGENAVMPTGWTPTYQIPLMQGSEIGQAAWGSCTSANTPPSMPDPVNPAANPPNGSTLFYYDSQQPGQTVPPPEWISSAPWFRLCDPSAVIFGGPAGPTGAGSTGPTGPTGPCCTGPTGPGTGVLLVAASWIKYSTVNPIGQLQQTPVPPPLPQSLPSVGFFHTTMNGGVPGSGSGAFDASQTMAQPSTNIQSTKAIYITSTGCTGPNSVPIHIPPLEQTRCNCSTAVQSK